MAQDRAKKVLILGGDGYLGWPTAMYLARLGYKVAAVDNYFRRWACHELNVEPLVDVPNMQLRAQIYKGLTKQTIPAAVGDITNYPFLQKVFEGRIFGEAWGEGPPDAVVHYAEQPSAPYSMIDREKAVFTLTNNLVGTTNLIHAVKEYNPDCHIVKLGTMGVYGTPNIDIEEGYLDVEHKGRKHTFLYPKCPGSLYHLTKAQDGDLLYWGYENAGLCGQVEYSGVETIGWYVSYWDSDVPYGRTSLMQFRAVTPTTPTEERSLSAIKSLY